MTASEPTIPSLLLDLHVNTLINRTRPTKIGSNTIESLDRSPDDVHIKQHRDNQGQPVYFTSNLNEGFANVEEITCANTPQPPDTNVQEIQELKTVKRHPSIYHVSPTGDGVGYGHQVGNTSGIDQEETEDSTGSDEESDDKKSEELLIATPIRHVHTSTEQLDFPLLFSDIYGVQSGPDLSRRGLTDNLRRSDSNESLYKIISDDSSDGGGILQHLPDFDLDLDTESENSFRTEGNIPNLQALGVTLDPFRRSFSAPATKTKTSTYNQGLITSLFSSTSSVRVDKTSTSSSRKDESDRKIHFCTTSTQSAIVEKIKSRRTTFDVSDVHNIFKKYDLKRSSDKSKEHVKDSDKASHSMTSIDDVIESDVDSAYETSIRESSVLPILKQELKYKIQVDRMKRGEPEVVLHPEQPKEYKLRPEEIRKKAERLMQNRLSARKSRIKATLYRRQLEMTIKEEMNKTARLRQEVMNLQSFRKLLQGELDDHLKVCPKGRHHSV